ncbi:hypothetical protein DP83_11855 [Vibrio metoecus]|uniref:PvuRts1 I-like SET and RING associated domain-containing protein n=1 Tax=Vibrio metoecus TaxID=1481663 RepID=A0ABR4RUB4_VIBMT|nr:hypothetical protein DP83_11855 [Vibrio metoecus]
MNEISMMKKHGLTLKKQLPTEFILALYLAKVKDSLGYTKYRFKGKYALNVGETDFKNGLVWERVATRVRTYKCAQ